MGDDEGRASELEKCLRMSRVVFTTMPDTPLLVILISNSTIHYQHNHRQKNNNTYLLNIMMRDVKGFTHIVSFNSRNYPIRLVL